MTTKIENQLTFSKNNINDMAENIFLRSDFFDHHFTRFLPSLEALVYTKFYFYAIKSNSQIGIGKILLSDFAFQSSIELEDLIVTVNSLCNRNLIKYDPSTHLFMINHYFILSPWSSGNPLIFAKKIMKEFQEKFNEEFWRDFVKINYKNLIELNNKIKNDGKNKMKINLDSLLLLKSDKSDVGI